MLTSNVDLLQVAPNLLTIIMLSIARSVFVVSFNNARCKILRHSLTYRHFISTTPICYQSHSTTNQVQVPPLPSWSVKELRLTSTDGEEEDNKISNEELATLARRCLIDIRRLSPERRNKLRTHIGGIMRCASVLLDSRNSDDNNINNDNSIIHDDNRNSSDKMLTDEDVYDTPRGLTKMPIRDDTKNDWKTDSNESKAIFQNESVKSKMIQANDGEFFSVTTNISKSKCSYRSMFWV